MKRLFALILALSVALCCGAAAAEIRDTFSAELMFDTDEDGNITVTVQECSILESQKPLLAIPCDYDAAYVTFAGSSVYSVLENGRLSFIVAAGGTYTIHEGVDPNPQPDPQPDPDPAPMPSVTPGSNSSSGSKAEDEGTVSVTVDNGTGSAGQAKITAQVEIANGATQVTLDSEELAESLQRAASDGESTVEAGMVTIDLSDPAKPVQSVTVDSASVSAIAQAAEAAGNAISGLTVKLGAGEVTLDAAVLTQAAASEAPLTVEICAVESGDLTEAQQEMVQSMPVVEITVTAGTKRLTDLGDGRVLVSLPYTLSADQSAEALVVWHILEDGTIVPIQCVYRDGRVLFRLDHLSRYAVVCFPFPDVAATEWYYADVAYAWVNGLMNGTGSGFTPAGLTTRGMVVTVLWRLAGEPAPEEACPFADVSADSYCAEAVTWAAENGIVTGVNETVFLPEISISREQFATILYRYLVNYRDDAGAVGELSGKLDYGDAAEISVYARDAMEWACGTGLLRGANGLLMPGANAARSQTAAILHRFCATAR